MGYCDVHYARFHKYGSPDIIMKPAHRITDACLIDGCKEIYFAKGYCKKHYYYHYAKPRLPKTEKKEKPKICIVNGCGKAAKVLGLCYGHYERQKNHGDVHSGGIQRIKCDGVCSVIGCEQKARSRSLCLNHYRVFSALPSVDYTKPFTCYICGRIFTSWPTRKDSNGGEMLSMDHIIPVCKGGTNDETNLAIACMSCNSKKFNMTYEELIIWCNKVIANSSVLSSEKS